MGKRGESVGHAIRTTRARAIGLCLLALAVAGSACGGSSSATDAGAKGDVGTTPDAQTTPDAGDAPADILLVAPTSDASAERGADVASGDAQPTDVATGGASDVASDTATGDASDVASGDASSGHDDASVPDVARADDSASDGVAGDASSTGPSADAGASDVSQHLAAPTYLGTYGVQAGSSLSPPVAIASDGSIFFGGAFDVAQDFDPGPNVDMRTPQGPSDAFLTKLNADGSYAWTLTFGGPQSGTVIDAIAVSDTAIVVAGGYTAEIDFDPGAGTHDVAASAINGTAGFVMSLTRDGAFSWVSPFVGSGGCGSSVLALGADGSIYMGGGYNGACDFDPGPDVDQRTSYNENGYLLKLAGDDGHSLWTQTYSGAACDGYINGISVANDGDVWVTGAINESCSFGGLPAPTTTTDVSTLIASFTPSGSADDLLTIPDGFGFGIAAAPDGSIYVGGAAGGNQVIDFDPGPGVANVNVDWPPNVDDSTGFVVKLGADRSFRWVVTAPKFPTAWLAATEEGGVLELAQVSPDGTQTDAFVVTKLTATGVSAWTLPLVGTNASAYAIDARGSTFAVAGSTAGEFDVDPGPATQILTTNVAFVSRYSF